LKKNAQGDRGNIAADSEVPMVLKREKSVANTTDRKKRYESQVSVNGVSPWWEHVAGCWLSKG